MKKRKIVVRTLIAILIIVLTAGFILDFSERLAYTLKQETYQSLLANMLQGAVDSNVLFCRERLYSQIQIWRILKLVLWRH